MTARERLEGLVRVAPWGTGGLGRAVKLGDLLLSTHSGPECEMKALGRATIVRALLLPILEAAEAETVAAARLEGWRDCPIWGGRLEEMRREASADALAVIDWQAKRIDALMEDDEAQRYRRGLEDGRRAGWALAREAAAKIAEGTAWRRTNCPGIAEEIRALEAPQ